MKHISKKNDDLSITGRVTITLRDKNGKIKERIVDNLVVTVGKYHVADQLSGSLQDAMSHMAIGIGDGAGGATTQDLADTQLQSELSRKAFTSKDQGSGGDSNKVIYVADWPSGEGEGALTEAGIFNAASGGTMLARTTFTVKNKGAGDSISITWTLTAN